MVAVSMRPAEPRDIPAIQHVAEQAWNTIYDETLPQDTIDAAIDEWYDSESLLQHVENSDVAYFVATETDRVTGFVTGTAGDDPRTGELGAIYVHPDHWRTGIGSQLIDRFETHAVDQAWDTIQIRVLADNDVARTFYEKHDYEQTTEGVVTLFGTDADEVVYWKRI